MANISDYQELGRAIADNVNAIYRNGSLQAIQDSLKEGGKLHSILKVLEEKEQNLEKTINGLSYTGEKDQTQNELINNFTKERQQLQYLQSQINIFSSSIGNTPSAFQVRKALNNFEYSVVQNKQINQGFFGTLLSVIYNNFVPKNPAKLESSSKVIDNLEGKLKAENQQFNAIQLAAHELEKEQEKTGSLSKSQGFRPITTPEEREQVANALEQIDLDNLEEAWVAYSKKPQINSPIPSVSDNIPLPPPQAKNMVKKSSYAENLDKKQKNASNKKVKMDLGGFTYMPEIGAEIHSDNLAGDIKSHLAKRRHSIEQDTPENFAKVEMEKLLKDKGESKQLNILYSAVINGNAKLVENLIEYGSTKIFSKENCQKILDAAKEASAHLTAPKKIIIEKGIKTLAKEVNLEEGKNSSLER